MYDVNKIRIKIKKKKKKQLKVDWEFLSTIKDPYKVYKTFLHVFSNLYEIAFPKMKIKGNSKIRLSPWI